MRVPARTTPEDRGEGFEREGERHMNGYVDIPAGEGTRPGNDHETGASDAAGRAGPGNPGPAFLNFSRADGSEDDPQCEREAVAPARVFAEATRIAQVAARALAERLRCCG